MKEQSHKDEMSAAIRGDFRRLRERGVASTLAPRAEIPPEPDPAAPLPEPEAVSLEPESAPEPRSEPADEAPNEVDEPVARPGFLARLLGR